MSTETQLKRRLCEGLRQRGIPHYRAGAGPYAHSGIADIIGCLPWNGRTLWLEAKRPGLNAEAHLTELQRKRAHEWKEAGALVIISSDYDHAMGIIDNDWRITVTVSKQ